MHLILVLMSMKTIDVMMRLLLPTARTTYRHSPLFEVAGNLVIDSILVTIDLKMVQDVRLQGVKLAFGKKMMFGVRISKFPVNRG